jgi:hypothetical protein
MTETENVSNILVFNSAIADDPRFYVQFILNERMFLLSTHDIFTWEQNPGFALVTVIINLISIRLIYLLNPLYNSMVT